MESLLVYGAGRLIEHVFENIQTCKDLKLLPLGGATSSDTLVSQTQSGSNIQLKLWPTLAVTKTTSRHFRLAEFGVSCITEAELSGNSKDDSKSPVEIKNEALKFDTVVFSIPLVDLSELRMGIKKAIELWNRKGKFIFISTGGVYQQNKGEIITEFSKAGDPSNPENFYNGILEIETMVIKNGGLVLRLAGLYDKDKGPHNFYRKKKSLVLNPNRWLNLIHYKDAGQAVLNLIIDREQGHLQDQDHHHQQHDQGQYQAPMKIFLLSDGCPIILRDFLAEIERKFELETEWIPDQNIGKRYDPTLTLKSLRLTLRYPKFDADCL